MLIQVLQGTVKYWTAVLEISNFMYRFVIFMYTYLFEFQHSSSLFRLLKKFIRTINFSPICLSFCLFVQTFLEKPFVTFFCNFAVSYGWYDARKWWQKWIFVINSNNWPFLAKNFPKMEVFQKYDKFCYFQPKGSKGKFLLF